MKNNLKFNKGDCFIKTVQVTNEMILGFADNSGDKNPVHLDESYASNTIFKKRIAHGFLVGSLISAILGNDFPGEGTIYLSQLMKFKAPVFIDDKIDVQVVILSFPKGKQILLETKCINQNGVVVIDGEAIVLPPMGSILIQ